MYRFGLKTVILVEKSQLINIAHNSKYCSEKKERFDIKLPVCTYCYHLFFFRPRNCDGDG